MRMRCTYGINVALGHMFHLHMFSHLPCNHDLNNQQIIMFSCFLEILTNIVIITHTVLHFSAVKLPSDLPYTFSSTPGRTLFL